MKRSRTTEPRPSSDDVAMAEDSAAEGAKPFEGGGVEMDGSGGGGGAAVEKAAAAAAAATAARHRDERTVFVKGLRMNLRDGELDPIFQACGDLVEVRLMRDPDGRFRVRDSL